jgi:3-phenylpropionate/trans-cinnamate dioxygenase ferredoxin component
MELEAAKVEDFGSKNMLPLSLDDVRVVLIRDDEGEIYALEDRCSHADVKLSRGECSGGQVVCPAHGAKFDIRTGKQLCMPAVAPVKSFPVRVTDGIIYISLENR